MQAAPKNAKTGAFAAGRCTDPGFCLQQGHEEGRRVSGQPPACGQYRAAERDATRRHGGLAPWQVRRLTLVIEARLAEALRSSDLAAVARLSVSHFSRAFTCSFQISPHAYVIGRRIASAKHLIATTNGPLCDIAMACGFADQPHLSRAFRQAVGQTPMSWRRNHRPALAEGVRASSEKRPGPQVAAHAHLGGRPEPKTTPPASPRH